MCIWNKWKKIVIVYLVDNTANNKVLKTNVHIEKSNDF